MKTQITTYRLWRVYSPTRSTRVELRPPPHARQERGSHRIEREASDDATAVHASEHERAAAAPGPSSRRTSASAPRPSVPSKPNQPTRTRSDIAAPGVSDDQVADRVRQVGNRGQQGPSGGDEDDRQAGQLRRLGAPGPRRRPVGERREHDDDQHAHHRRRSPGSPAAAGRTRARPGRRSRPTSSALTAPGIAMLTISSASRASPVRIRLSTSSSRRLTNWESTL